MRRSWQTHRAGFVPPFPSLARIKSQPGIPSGALLILWQNKGPYPISAMI